MLEDGWGCTSSLESIVIDSREVSDLVVGKQVLCMSVQYNVKYLELPPKSIRDDILLQKIHY